LGLGLGWVVVVVMLWASWVVVVNCP
jgi:hypothetical protein